MVTIEDARIRAEVNIEKVIDQKIEDAILRGECKISIFEFSDGIGMKVIEKYITHGYKRKEIVGIPFLIWE